LNAGGFNRSAAGGSRFQSLGGRNGFGRGNAFAGGNFANQTGNNIKSGKQFNNDPTKTYASNNGNTTNNVYASGSVNASGYPPASAAAYPAGYPAAYPTTYPAANPYAAGAAAGWAASKYNQATQPSYGYGYMPPVLPPITINAPTTTSQAPAGPAPTQQSSQSEELNNTATKARVFARNFASEVQAMRAQQMSRYANGQPIPQAVPYAVPQPITQSAR